MPTASPSSSGASGPKARLRAGSLAPAPPFRTFRSTRPRVDFGSVERRRGRGSVHPARTRPPLHDRAWLRCGVPRLSRPPRTRSRGSEYRGSARHRASTPQRTHRSHPPPDLTYALKTRCNHLVVRTPGARRDEIEGTRSPVLSEYPAPYISALRDSSASPVTKCSTGQAGLK